MTEETKDQVENTEKEGVEEVKETQTATEDTTSEPEKTIAEGEASEETEEKSVKKDLPENMEELIKNIEQMSVLELSDLVKALEDRFGVSASAPVAAFAAGAAPAAGGAAAAEEEKSVFDVVLASAGDKKINVIKEIRALTSLGLKEAKDLVEAAPKVVKEGATKEEAEKIKKQLEEVGAKVELK